MNKRMGYMKCPRPKCKKEWTFFIYDREEGSDGLVVDWDETCLGDDYIACFRRGCKMDYMWQIEDEEWTLNILNAELQYKVKYGKS